MIFSVEEFESLAHNIFGRHFRKNRGKYGWLRERLIKSRMETSVDQWLSVAVFASLVITVLMIPSLYLYLTFTGAYLITDPMIVTSIVVVLLASLLLFSFGRFRIHFEITFSLKDKKYAEEYPLNRLLYFFLSIIIATIFILSYPAILVFILDTLQSILSLLPVALVVLSENFLYILLPVVSLLVSMGVFLAYPTVRAWHRKREIDSLAPSAVSLLGSVAGVGLTPLESIRFLAKEEAYGEFSEEMRYLVRDIELFGYDLVAALGKLSEETPSERLKSFIQGAIATITSGGNLRKYLMIKSEEYSRSNTKELGKFLETLGIIAEVFLIAGVVTPILLITMFAIMAMMGEIPLVVLYGTVAIVPAVTALIVLLVEAVEPPYLR